MDRKETTIRLSALLEDYINPKKDSRIYYAKEVTFDYGSKDQCRVDYMQFKPKNNSVSGIEQGIFYAYEIKSSVEDFNSGHGTNFNIGDMTYLVTTEDVYKCIERKVPHWVGFMVPSTDTYSGLKVVRKAKPHDRQRPVSEMLLMMFRSANRDIIKAKKKEME